MEKRRKWGAETLAIFDFDLAPDPANKNKKFLKKLLTFSGKYLIISLQGKGNRYSHSTDQVLSLKQEALQ